MPADNIDVEADRLCESVLGQAIQDSNAGSRVCVACFEPCETYVTTCACHCMMCKPCLRRWLARKRQCAICNRDVIDDVETWRTILMREEARSDMDPDGDDVPVILDTLEIIQEQLGDTQNVQRSSFESPNLELAFLHCAHALLYATRSDTPAQNSAET